MVFHLSRPFLPVFPPRNFNVDVSRWLIRVVCGGFEIRTVYAGNTQARCCIFSRLSAERVGTRFECRGANDTGYVANFCETEQIIYVDDQVRFFSPYSQKVLFIFSRLLLRLLPVIPLPIQFFSVKVKKGSGADTLKVKVTAYF